MTVLDNQRVGCAKHRDLWVFFAICVCKRSIAAVLAAYIRIAMRQNSSRRSVYNAKEKEMVGKGQGKRSNLPSCAEIAEREEDSTKTYIGKQRCVRYYLIIYSTLRCAPCIIPEYVRRRRTVCRVHLLKTAAAS